jgi:hypothetical protein
MFVMPAAAQSNCCIANGGVGCDDPACQEAVCAIDPFCCDVAWDGICAGEAADLCKVCGTTGGCPKSANDCCVASPDGTPGCNQPACCESVCALDPFCCDTSWDGICAGEALVDPNCECGVGGCPKSANDCCVASPDGTPGCNQPACCESVCALDPFCCDTAWDGICAGEALADPNCDCGVGVPNDNCVDRIDIFNGSTKFSNIGATTDGPSPCGSLGSDIWYNYIAECTGSITIDTFGSTYDTAIAAYDGCECPTAPASNCCSANGGLGCDNDKCEATVCAADPFCCDVAWDGVCAAEAADLCGDLCVGGGSPLIACNDDTGGTLQSQITINVVQGNCYKFQVGGFAALQGTGVINVTKGPDCVAGACPPSANDCCVASPDGTPGCNQPACCESVCAIDPFCCDTAWDGICAGEAQADPNCKCGPICNEECPSDLSPPGGNGNVGAEDLGQLLANWGLCPGCCEDLNGDGEVDAADLGELLADWGLCACGTSTNDCCVDNDTPGCNQPACCESVCAADPFCCDVAWDGLCADAAATDPNCKCDVGVCPPSENDCCVASPDGTPGCNNDACCEIVCAADPFCCDTAWDSICAGEAQGIPECNCVVDACPPSKNDCCVASPDGTPGCNNDACCEIVCAADPFCCDTAWDGLCADAAAAIPECNCGAGVCDKGNPNDCCVASPGGTPGCNNVACCEIVCAADPFCCDTAWDGLCAGAAAAIPECNCAVGGCPKSANDCCVASPDGTPGCNNDACCEIVCAADPFCCDTSWDGLCAGAAAAIPECNCGAGACDKGNPQDCLVGGDLPGCNDVACCKTVCAVDPFCCETAWDSICAGEAADLCGADLGNCCEPHGGLGCDNDDCEAAVCAVDPFCCETAWDLICAGEAADLCGCVPPVEGCDKGNPQDCSVGGPLGGCNDVACCQTVCAVDPFCCDTSWDGICVGEAAKLCGG